MIVVGNGGVGKTSMVRRIAKGQFTEGYKKTIGVDFVEKDLELASGEEVRLMLWDTAGQEEFDAVTRTYYRGAGAVVYVFSTTDRASFDELPEWVAKVTAEAPGIAAVVVQNKVDLLEQAVVTPEEAEELASRLRLKFYRTSVKDDVNVRPMFEYLAESALARAKTAGVPGQTNMDFLSPAQVQAEQQSFSIQPTKGKSRAAPSSSKKGFCTIL